MALTNYDTKEIHCKILYMGSSGSGKSENLRSLYNLTSEEVRAGLVKLVDDPKRNHFLDFLPLSLGTVRDFHFKLHLYTVPEIELFQTVPEVLAKGIDGLVFVADSGIEQLGNNIDSLQKCKDFLCDQGCAASDLPKVIQYNKRDSKTAAPITVMRKALNTVGDPDREAIATQNNGTLETIVSMGRMVLRRMVSQ